MLVSGGQNMTNRKIGRVLIGSMIAIAGVAGGILQFTSTSGNLANTVSRLGSEGWFAMMVAMGALGLGFVGLVVFAAVGPDSKRPS
jgi:hypothetical protein